MERSIRLHFHRAEGMLTCDSTARMSISTVRSISGCRVKARCERIRWRVSTTKVKPQTISKGPKWVSMPGMKLVSVRKAEKISTGSM